MLFRYTDPEGVDKSVDTDSKPFLQRLDWLKKNGAPQEHSLLFGINRSPKSDGNGNVIPGEFSTIQTGTIVWTENAFTYGTDVFLTFASPSVALIELLKAYGKPVPPVAPQFVEPPAGPVDTTAKDWEAAGAPIGPPLPGQPGKYQSRGTGKQIGDRWVGPSGRTYEMRSSGLGPLAFRFWQEV